MSLPKSISIGDKTYRRSKKTIGDGGNGSVYQAMCDGKQYALKVLPANARTIQLRRFIREVKVLKENCDLSGIPNFYGAVIRRNRKLPSYYVMELGCSISEFLKDKNTDTRIKVIKELATTLNQLKERGIAHRDIKPENILMINDSPVLCDFGLAHGIGNARLTAEGDRQIGARMTMAPEMLRDPYNSNFYQADTYSLAKTAWILLTKDKNSFDGCYSTHGKESLWNYQVEVLGDLERMLTDCTSSAPNKRWEFTEIIDCCKKWLAIHSDSYKREQEGWRQIKRRIAPYSEPDKCTWTNIEDIITVLNLVLSHGCRTFSFLPNGGDLQLESVQLSHESSCIELVISGGCPIILKPKELSFYSPGKTNYNEQDYFLLQTDKLELISPFAVGEYEELTEIEPGNYTDVRCSEWDDYNGNPLPTEARAVCRWSEGTFGVFLVTSIYCQKGLPFLGRFIHSSKGFHSDLEPDHFYRLFEKSLGSAKISIESSVTYTPVETTSLTLCKLTDSQLSDLKILLDKLKSTACYRNSFAKRKLSVEEAIEEDSSFSFRDAFLRNAEVETVFKEFSEDQLQLFAAVMYGGRDNTPPFGASLDVLLKRRRSASSNLHSLSGKGAMTVCEYIEAGIDMFK